MNNIRKQIQDVENRILEASDVLEAVGKTAETEGRAMNADELKIVDDTTASIETMLAQKESLNAVAATLDKVSSARVTEKVIEDSSNPGAIALKADSIRSISRKVKNFDDAKTAYACGQWLLSEFAGRKSAKEWVAQNREFFNVQQVGDDTLGGYTVPTPLAATVIRLVEEAGIYPNAARNVPMSSMTLDIPVRDAGTSVFYIGENAAFTPSDVTFNQISLVAKKMGQLTIMSNEVGVDADSIIGLADLVAREMGHAFAHAIDDAAFLGDGTATYGGITGIQNALQPGSKINVADAAGISLDTINEAVGRVPMYEGIMPSWYMHNYTYHTVIKPLLQNANGSDGTYIEDGGRPNLCGYPVVFTPTLPGQAATTGDMPIVFGDLDMGCLFGLRRAVSMKVLDQLYAVNDQTGLISSMRYDAVCHSVGDATNAGAVVSINFSAGVLASGAGKKAKA